MLSLGGCTEPAPPATQASSVPVARASFTDHFELVDTVTPEQTETNPIIRISGAFITADRIGIVDVSEGNAKLFDRNGTLQNILGGKGTGPGEFDSPRHVLQDGEGRIIVGDAGTPRITTFDPLADTVLRVIQPPVPWVGSVNLLPDGRFVISGVGTGSEGHVVAIMTRAAETVTTHFPLSNTLPSSAKDPAPWRSLTVFSAAAIADTVFVASSISDSLWSRSPAGDMAAYHLQIPDYEAPTDPETPPRNTRELTEWSRSFHTATGLLSGDRFLVMQLVKGVLNYGDPSIAVYRNRYGAWFAINDAPPIVAAGGEEVLVIANPLEDPVRLAIYRARR